MLSTAARRIEGLPTSPVVFGTAAPLPEEPPDRILQSGGIRRIICFSLGPQESRLCRVSHAWINRMGVSRKAEIALCRTPEACLANTLGVKEPGVLAIFWTCPLEQGLQFFSQNNVFPLFSQQIMALDEMVLATTEAKLSEIEGGRIPKLWKISLSYLFQYLLREVIPLENTILVTNFTAAYHCVTGVCDACVTTYPAARINGLRAIHSFGRPTIIFFGGATDFGLSVLKKAQSALV